MTLERWRQIEAIYHAALSRDATARGAFLANACAGDEALQREVESLLAQPASTAGFLDGPAIAVAAQTVSDIGASVLSGRRLGAYQVRECIGVGGMGEVYCALDTKLGRDVAIKILPRLFTNDPERLARFEREAHVLASLNHPHIGAIYGLEDFDGLRALVLELVDGETLACRIARGPIPLNDTLAIARQIADALDAAHGKGIIHRDLKPANIKITSDGVVKVLDFGLAKAAVADGSTPALSQLPTMTAEGTREGIILGTAAYMSPEQARGQTVDKRTDIWAFSCVLYEMLTGRSVFARETLTDTLAAILEREPDWNALPPDTPASVRRLIARCLRKDPKARLRDISDAWLDFETPDDTAPPRQDGVATHLRLATLAVLGLGCLVMAAGLWVWARGRQSPTADESRPIRFTLAFDGLTTEERVPIPSMSGTHLALTARDASGMRSLWVRALDSSAAQRIPDTSDAFQPFWSGDGRWIGFYGSRKLKKVSLSGGGPQAIVDLPEDYQGVQGATWNARGDIIYTTSNRAGLFVVRDSGGVPRQLTTLDRARTENSHRFPQFLPDGVRFLFVARCNLRENNALYLGNLDTGETRRILVQSNVRYIGGVNNASGALLFVRDGALVEQPFDGERVSGEAVPVVDHIAYNATSAAGAFEASSSGDVMVFRTDPGGVNRLTWFDRAGRVSGTAGPPGNYGGPRISADGKRVLFNRPDDQTGNRDLWYMEVDRGIAQRLTTHLSNDWQGVWSPDGAQILFTSDRDLPATRNATRGLYVKAGRDAGVNETPWWRGPVNKDAAALPVDWSRDGLWIALGRGAGSSGIWIDSTIDRGRPFAFLQSQFDDDSPRFSPDSKWIAYVSNESGRPEVYVRPFAGGKASGAKIRISADGGDFPVWRANGRELFFLSGDMKIYAASTARLGKAPIAPPVPLFTVCPDQLPATLPMQSAPWGHVYDVTPDGDRFLVACRLDAQAKFEVALNRRFRF